MEQVVQSSSSSHIDSIQSLEQQVNALDIKYSPFSTPRRSKITDEPKWLIDLKRNHQDAIRHVDAKIRRFEKLLDRAKRQKEDLAQHFAEQINDYCYYHQSKQIHRTPLKRRAVKRLYDEKHR